MTEDQFIAAVENHTFPPAQFDHRAHVWLAWLYLERLPLPEAIARTGASLKGFAESLGVYDKFHWTVTEALVRIMDARRRHGQTFDDYAAENGDLMTDTRALIAAHYSPERLAEPAARSGYLPPDRKAM